MSKINVAVQLIPQAPSKKELYAIVDEAISQIQESGMKYKVCPFETVIEGEYDEVMDLVKKIQFTALERNVEGTITNLKIQMNKNADAIIEDKIGKYE